MMNKLKECWEASRINLGYYFWIGVPIINLIFMMQFRSMNIFIITAIHFLGLFMVAKYDWFSKEKNK